MDDFIVRVEIPLDEDGFLLRECSSCERQFKWHSDDSDEDQLTVLDQYFCPLCGAASGTENWWTEEQIEYAKGAAAPEIDQVVQSALNDAFRGMKGISFKPNPHFTLDIETPPPPAESTQPMVHVEPPCHLDEPLKVPADSTASLYCLICGSRFAA
jgi:hypothetical protein